MNRAYVITLLIASCLLPALGQDEKKPENLKMSLAWVVDEGEPKQYVFVINGTLAFKTIDGVKNYMKTIPENSTLTWDPGCCRMGDEPLLSSKKDMDEFRKFCDENHVKFVLVPSG